MRAAGIRLYAAAAATLGLVHEVAPPQDLPDEVRDLPVRLAARPQSHMAATCRLYRGEDPNAYRRHLDSE